MSCLCGLPIKKTFDQRHDELIAKAFFDGFLDIDGNQVRKGKPMDNIIEHRLVTHLSRKYIGEDELCGSCKTSANRILMSHKYDSFDLCATAFIMKRLESEITNISINKETK